MDQAWTKHVHDNGGKNCILTNVLIVNVFAESVSAMAVPVTCQSKTSQVCNLNLKYMK